MKTTNVTSRVLMLGDNDFYAGKIILAAGATLAAGAVLKRGGGNTIFEIATSADEYTAVNPFEIKNETSGSKEFGFRPCVSGRVREDMLRVGDATITASDIDKLRKVGILPMKVTDLSHPDNQ